MKFEAQNYTGSYNPFSISLSKSEFFMLYATPGITSGSTQGEEKNLIIKISPLRDKFFSYFIVLNDL